MNQLAVIHIAKKQLGIDDDTYREMLQAVTGKASSRDMNAAERGRVIDEFRRLGWKDGKPAERASKNGRKPLEGKFAPKLQALWISGWHLGVIRDNSDEALLKFVRRQTGVDHTRFLHYADDARKAVEALKSMLEREGGVDWGPRELAPPWKQSEQAKVAEALVRRAASLGLFKLTMNMSARLETVAGKPGPLFTRRDWVRVHKHYGQRIRDVQKAARQQARHSNDNANEGGE